MVLAYISALSHAHWMADMDNPTTKFWVKKVTDAEDLQAVTSIPHKPITLRILHKLVTVARWDIPDYEASLMRAIFSVAFHTCAKIGEVVCSNGQPQHAILVQNVIIGTDQLEVTFISFKHHWGGGESQSPECCMQPSRKYAQPDCCQSMWLSDQAHGPGLSSCGSQEGKWVQLKLSTPSGGVWRWLVKTSNA